LAEPGYFTSTLKSHNVQGTRRYGVTILIL
jgi:hypothetical protein